MRHCRRLSSCYVLSPVCHPASPSLVTPDIPCYHRGPLTPASFSLTVLLSHCPSPPNLPISHDVWCPCLLLTAVLDPCVVLTPACPPCLSSGVERTLLLPGSQTTFDLDDVRAGISYTVRVSARVGTHEGDASTLTIHRGEHFRRLTGDGD